MSGESAEFIESYLQGDSAAVGEVDRWITAAASSFRRRLGEQWEDVLQDVRLEVFRVLERGQFRGESNLRTYVWRIVNHSCLDHIRKESKWTWTEVEESDEAQSIADRRRQDATVTFETADLLLRILERVSEECRDLWRLIVEGFSYREIGERMGVQEGALRVRALRCRKRALAIREELLPDADSPV